MLRGVWWLWNQLAIVNRRIITQTVMNVNVNPGRETDDVCMVNHETEKGSCSKNKLCTVTYIWSRAQRCMTVSKWKFQYPLPWMNNAFIIYLFSLLLIFLLLFAVVLSWPKIENMFCEWKFCTRVRCYDNLHSVRGAEKWTYGFGSLQIQRMTQDLKALIREKRVMLGWR